MRTNVQHQNFHPGQHVVAHGRHAIVAFVANGRAYGHVPGVGVPIDLGRVSDFDPCGTEGAERQLELGRTAKLTRLGVPCELEAESDASADGVVTLFRPTWDPARSRSRTRTLTPVAA